MKKIIYINSYSFIGGAEKSLQSIILGVNEKEIKPIVVLGERGEFSDWCEENSISYKVILQPSLGHKVTKYKKLLRLIIFTMQLLFFMAICRCRFIHTNTTRSRVYCSLVALLPFVIAFAHVRDIEELPVQKLLLRAYNKTIVISKAVEQVVSKGMDSFLRNKIVLIYNGVEEFSEKSEMLDVRKLNDNGSLRVGMFARFDSWKGQDLFILAIIDRINRGDNIEGYIFGDAIRSSEIEFYNYCQSLVPKEYMDYFHFMGMVKSPRAYMKEMDVIVCPSINEPFGRVVIEAMSCPKPVFCSKGGGFLEILNNELSSFFFEEGNYKEIAKKIGEFQKEPSVYLSKCSSLYKRYECKFSSKYLIENILALYG
jgi:glycosyltransferase involved in cell wall biosynthesis